MPRRVRVTGRYSVVLDDLSTVNALDVLELVRSSDGTLEYPPGRYLTRQDIERLDSVIRMTEPGFRGLVHESSLAKLATRIRIRPADETPPKRNIFSVVHGTEMSSLARDAGASPDSSSDSSLSSFEWDADEIRLLANRNPATAWVMAGSREELRGIVREVFWGTPRQ